MYLRRVRLRVVPQPTQTDAEGARHAVVAALIGAPVLRALASHERYKLLAHLHELMHLHRHSALPATAVVAKVFEGNVHREVEEMFHVRHRQCAIVLSIQHAEGGDDSCPHPLPVMVRGVFRVAGIYVLEDLRR